MKKFIFLFILTFIILFLQKFFKKFDQLLFLFSLVCCFIVDDDVDVVNIAVIIFTKY